jgi:hypothetical protein
MYICICVFVCAGVECFFRYGRPRDFEKKRKRREKEKSFAQVQQSLERKKKKLKKKGELRRSSVTTPSL